jgi:hypothetical protein
VFMQNLLNYTALAAGVATTPRGIGALAATIVVGRIAGHISNRFLISASALLMAYSCFMLGDITSSLLRCGGRGRKRPARRDSKASRLATGRPPYLKR